MVFKINNTSLPLNQMGYNDGLNFGRYDASLKMEFVDFELILSNTEIIECIEQDYFSIRNEIRLDDIIYADESSFQKAGYKDLKDLLFPNSGLEAIILDYLDRKIYQKLTQFNMSPNYIINGTSQILIEVDTIRIIGKAGVKRT
jgi:hypothetical protein